MKNVLVEAEENIKTVVEDSFDKDGASHLYLFIGL